MGFEDFGFWAAAITAAILVGMSKGGLPIVAMLSVPIMTLVINPVMAAGLLLPVYVVSDMFGLWAYRRDFDRLLLRILIPPCILGVAIGWATATLVPERLVTGLIGLIGAAFALNLLLRHAQEGPPRKPRLGPGWFWGTVAGFTSFVSHSGGPPYQVYVLPLRLKKTVFAGTTTILFAIINAVKLIPYYFLGQLSADNLHVALLLMLPASLAVFAGVRLVRILPEKLFFQIVTWALLAISLKLLWDAARGG
ncbi:sulfite exporter TauE/SafE family protein [Frigidibacter sp. ROC022]|uniref:sulfite exporter TauE/SafE family protein n=1 Tax=Frigidibacter sp. ROC022 TaxID=2971796 RepID=UPI00215B59DB|nr:sulfite exporter TauE/SafE family protein [Frigidibacter sp. ROC022]MCR8724070.1 sulfite exporter TauE/SafE family protein [Frigidibacter sp. ROC022]